MQAFPLGRLVGDPERQALHVTAVAEVSGLILAEVKSCAGMSHSVRIGAWRAR